MVSPKDFVGVGIWLALLISYRLATEYDLVEIDLNKQDKVFVGVVLLVTIELLWLRIGYSAP
jgi:hypothetical protein